MTVEWDIYKAIANWFKHGVSFGQAVTALEDPNAFITPGTVAAEETRFKLVGEVNEAVRSGPANIVVVVYTKRGKDIKRIISARPASVEERRGYEERR